MHRLEFQSLLGDKLDPSNAYLTFHAGAGGTVGVELGTKAPDFEVRTKDSLSDMLSRGSRSGGLAPNGGRKVEMHYIGG